MSDFIAANLHKKVDHLMDIFFGAGVASHPTIIEQINYLLFMRALSQKDEDLKKIGITDPDKIVFDGELEKYHWDNLLTLNAEQLFVALEECFRKIPESTTNRTVRLVFRNAHIKLFDKPSLRTVVHELDAFAKLMDDVEHDGKRDIFGDTYEYLLSKLSQAGTSGQFRTPRHIIEFLVAVVAPKKGETILDPAVGTAGFLVKAFEYLRSEYTSPEQLASGGAFDKLSSKEHSFLYEHTFNGFDSDEDMIKFGMMNLYLHGLQNARMVRQNSLTDTAGNRDKFDIILANPPFSGKIDRDSVAEELQMNTGATEVLFLRYMMRHLSENGRIGVIVPEGVLFNSSSAHTKIRQFLLENGLWCIVSLPSGVFSPYAGVKTSILFIDKTKKNNKEVLITKVAHDGFSLNSQRRPIVKNDLPDILADIKRYEKGENIQHPGAHVVTYDQIKNTSDTSLTGDRYKLAEETIHHKFEMAAISEIALINPPKSEVKELPNDKYVSFVPMSDLNDNGYYFSPKQLKQVGELRAGYTYFSEGDILLAKVTPCFENGKCGIARNLEAKVGFGSSEYMVIRPNNKLVLTEYLSYFLKEDRFINSGKKTMTGSGGLKRVPRHFLENYKIPLPPIAYQKEIIKEIHSKQKAINLIKDLVLVLENEASNFNPGNFNIEGSWQKTTLGELAHISRGKSSSTKTIPGKYPLVLTAQNRKTADHYDFDGEAVLVPLISSTGHGKADIKTVHLQTGKFAAANLLAVIIPKSKEINIKFLQLSINAKKDQIAKTKMTGATNVSMKVSDLYDVTISIPTREVQDQIVAEFEEVERVKNENVEFLKKYETKIAQVLSGVWGD